MKHRKVHIEIGDNINVMKKPWSPFVDTGKRGLSGERILMNSRYHVQMEHLGYGSGKHPFGEVLELSIKRHDREPIMDWRDLQRLKNEVIGPDATMVQFFPPEKYLMDTANQYYFYAFTEYEFPFLKKIRAVQGKANLYDAKQRPFSDEHRPADLDEQQARWEGEMMNRKRSGGDG